MAEIRQYLNALLAGNKYPVTEDREQLLEKFADDEANIQMIGEIEKLQKNIMASWELKARLSDIANKQIIIPNGTVMKPYTFLLDLNALGLDDMREINLDGLRQYGLSYNPETGQISGSPLTAGDFKLNLKFKLDTEDSAVYEKQVTLIINADPKSLWKNIPSTQEPGNYWKPDQAETFQQLGQRHIVAASKRGRSHANVGSFREDDFDFRYFEETGWSLVCVADGAGSARLSREGSRLACSTVVEYFAKTLSSEDTKEPNEATRIFKHLPGAVHAAYQHIEQAAEAAGATIKDFHTTLIFTLFKKFESGYALLSFGVGDCPIGLIGKNNEEIKLLNWLDVGEFSGGTRFLTMPEIFSSDKFSSRFQMTLTDDFDYLMLMTDGIYDAKFVVEANLEKAAHWKAFIEDLNGENADGAKVELDRSNSEIATQLSAWMDFWSPGNHDDRTLAIIF
ncbi:MAG TPA: PP2C family serine/threonine-protein phosphatase [Pedobacter sp.]|uniref:PP2C family serine/threonine-protein phosphatase n=1 Tax=Pedobacter sp. TaxID=1411316 RepID=UPI002C728177|nr:PP2C family serine/threonine-protein phosphatase [Pedobacter sp.]HMI03691.1 PP2C family serine/threonine-protein phosphatase [Pedobacter sp.]